ncbi:hypothetical protein [Myceligenerans indicum]|uniref:Rhomboid family intramembrane serine protease n=1 Tax=Myceligenerans indicum TaxID=2593663 RepID=A0ABS1LFI5_9MICO|nr:hypothetical protein [Myceligenerans indicum]MBL0884960.1 rhomboid family intramembrane serine protease [Myceligenerans indicum]
MDLVIGLCLWVVYLAGWTAIRGATAHTPQERLPRPTPWGIGLFAAVAAPSLLQFALPGLYDAGRRDVAAIADGEWWRFLTSLVLQDGGWLGTAFNLVTLAISVALVGTVLRGPVMVAGFLVGGVVSNVLTVVLLGESGAGNSMATLFLVAATAILAWFRVGRGRTGRGRGGALPVAALTAGAVVLLVLHDQHGLAVTSGILAGVAAALAVRRSADA